MAAAARLTSSRNGGSAARRPPRRRPRRRRVPARARPASARHGGRHNGGHGSGAGARIGGMGGDADRQAPASTSPAMIRRITSPGCRSRAGGTNRRPRFAPTVGGSRRVRGGLVMVPPQSPARPRHAPSTTGLTHADDQRGPGDRLPPPPPRRVKPTSISTRDTMTLTATRGQRRSPSPAWASGLYHGDPRRHPPVGGADDDQGPIRGAAEDLWPYRASIRRPFAGQWVTYGPYPVTVRGPACWQEAR